MAKRCPPAQAKELKSKYTGVSSDAMRGGRGSGALGSGGGGNRLHDDDEDDEDDVYASGRCTSAFCTASCDSP